MNKTIDFKSGYNNKLRCDYFSAIQLADESFKKGASVEISLGGFSKGKAKIVGLTSITLDKVNDTMTYLDSACNAKEFAKKFKADFEHRPAINWKNEPMVYLILKWEGKDRMNSLFTK